MPSEEGMESTNPTILASKVTRTRTASASSNKEKTIYASIGLCKACEVQTVSISDKELLASAHAESLAQRFAYDRVELPHLTNIVKARAFHRSTGKAIATNPSP
jgi:hypothetical protein